jgi:hypothetical protein
MASPTIHVAAPTTSQDVFPYVARVAPTTTGNQAARASACTLGDELLVRDVSEDRVNPSPTSVPTAEAREYRARRSAAKAPEHRHGQRDQEPQRCRAVGEHDLSESRTCLQSQHGSGQTSTNGTEETSQPTRFHASAGTNVGEGSLPNLRSGGSPGTRRCSPYRGISQC